MGRFYSLGQHPPDLMEFALPCSVITRQRAGPELSPARGLGINAVPQRHPRLEGRRVRRVCLPSISARWTLSHGAGGQQPVSQRSVIGEQQQSLCVLVQPSHWKQVLIFRGSRSSTVF